MKHMYVWFVVTAIVGACAIGLAVSPPDSNGTNSPTVISSTNQPPPDPGPDQSIPLGGTNQTSRTATNGMLPPMYQGTISNLHDRTGTNAVNQGNDNPEPQPPHVPTE
jgi:hypothetical protein